MLINVTFEVDSKQDLVEIIQTGKDHSLLDCNIIDFELSQQKIKTKKR